jgi:hypothetical protein
MPLFHWAMPSRSHSIHKNDLARAMVAQSEQAFLALAQGKGPAAPAVKILEYKEMELFRGRRQRRAVSMMMRQKRRTGCGALLKSFRNARCDRRSQVLDCLRTQVVRPRGRRARDTWRRVAVQRPQVRNRHLESAAPRSSSHDGCLRRIPMRMSTTSARITCRDVISDR